MLGIQLYDVEGHLKTAPQLIKELSGALYGQVTATAQVGGRTKEQNDELKRLAEIQGSVTQDIRDYEAGIKGATLSDDKRAKKLVELRAKLANTEAAMQPLLAIEGKMTTVTRQLTEEQRNQAIQTLAGTYGMKAMNALLAEGAEGWEDMEEKVMAGASAHEVAEARMDTFAGAMERLKGSIETLLIRVGLPLINNFAKPLVEVIDRDLMPAFDAWAKESLPRIIDQVMAFGTAAKTWVMETAIPAVQGFITSIDWEAIRTFLGDVVTRVQEVGGKAVEWITGIAIPAIQGFITSIDWEAIGGFLGGIVTKLGEIKDKAVEWITGIAIPAIQGFLDKIDWPAIKQAFTDLISKVTEVGGNVGLWIEGVAIPAIQGFLDKIDWPAIKQAFTDLISKVMELGANVTLWVTETAIPAVQDFLTEIDWEGIKTKLDEVRIKVDEVSGSTAGWHEDLMALNEFVQVDLMRMFDALNNVQLALHQQKLESLRKLWDNLLDPTLQRVWAFLQTNLLPALILLGAELGGLPTILALVRSGMDGVKGGLEKLKPVIETITKKLNDLADAIKKMTLPWWLVPGSPTPFEIGLRGIADAMGEIEAATRWMAKGPAWAVSHQGAPTSAATAAVYGYRQPAATSRSTQDSHDTYHETVIIRDPVAMAMFLESRREQQLRRFAEGL